MGRRHLIWSPYPPDADVPSAAHRHGLLNDRCPGQEMRALSPVPQRWLHCTCCSDHTSPPASLINWTGLAKHQVCVSLPTQVPLSLILERVQQHMDVCVCVSVCARVCARARTHAHMWRGSLTQASASPSLPGMGLLSLGASHLSSLYFRWGD